MLEKIGQGSYGKVKKAYTEFRNEKKYYAIKYFRKKTLKKMKQYYKDKKGKVKLKDALTDLQREIAIMKKINHKNLI